MKAARAGSAHMHPACSAERRHSKLRPNENLSFAGAFTQTPAPDAEEHVEPPSQVHTRPS